MAARLAWWARRSSAWPALWTSVLLGDQRRAHEGSAWLAAFAAGARGRGVGRAVSQHPREHIPEAHRRAVCYAFPGTTRQEAEERGGLLTATMTTTIVRSSAPTSAAKSRKREEERLTPKMWVDHRRLPSSGAGTTRGMAQVTTARKDIDPTPAHDHGAQTEGNDVAQIMTGARVDLQVCKIAPRVHHPAMQHR